MNSNILTKEQIAQRLRSVFVGYNVSRATLFGSYSKDEATAASDIDLLVDSKLKGMAFVGLIEAIREALDDKPVDVLDVSHIVKGSKVDKEIESTGMLIYAK